MWTSSFGKQQYLMMYGTTVGYGWNNKWNKNKPKKPVYHLQFSSSKPPFLPRGNAANQRKVQPSLTQYIIISKKMCHNAIIIISPKDLDGNKNLITFILKFQNASSGRQITLLQFKCLQPVGTSSYPPVRSSHLLQPCRKRSANPGNKPCRVQKRLSPRRQTLKKAFEQ